MSPTRRRELVDVKRRIREVLGANPLPPSGRYRIPTRPTLWQRILRLLTPSPRRSKK